MLHKQRLKAMIVHTVHDCIIIDCPPSEVAAVKKILNKAFLTPVKAFPMKMDIDIEVSECWGEKNDTNLEGFLNELAA
jgi:DNA polymerase I-like protein with 3'-5' exonuclease and polymerase domains